MIQLPVLAAMAFLSGAAAHAHSIFPDCPATVFPPGN